MAAGKTAGPVDVKVVKFSDTHTAEKFVIPLAKRKAWPGWSIVVFGRQETLGAGKAPDELSRVVDQNRQVLRADSDRRTAIFDRDERDIV